MSEQESREIAMQFMRNIAYDNDCVNRLEEMTYPERHVKAIAIAAKIFFEYNPDEKNDLAINTLSCENDFFIASTFGKMLGFAELKKALDNYFEQL